MLRHTREERKDFEPVDRFAEAFRKAYRAFLIREQHAIRKITSGFAGRKREKEKKGIVESRDTNRASIDLISILLRVPRAFYSTTEIK